MKKELGLHPFGSLPSYSYSILPPGTSAQFNSRERESLDIQYANLLVTWMNFGTGDKELGRVMLLKAVSFPRVKGLASI